MLLALTDDPTLKNSLFGAVTLTKNADIDKYRYAGYGIGFDRKTTFSFPNGGFGQKNVVKNLIVKVFNLMSRTNETRHIEWYETCKCKCRLDGSVCNHKQHGMMINVGVNAKNWLIKECVIKDLFGT